MRVDQVGQPEAPPLVQSILWTPRKLATGVAPRVEADLVFSQPALKQARDHASSSPNAPVGGILLGRIREDPTCGRKWVLVQTAVRARRLLPEDASAEILWAALEEVIDTGRAGEVVGWYRTHARTGVYLSEQEARLQEDCFGRPWQCAMILAGSAEHPVGGVFQRTEAGALSRSGYTAFFELIDPSSEFAPGWKRTFVGWSNYQTDLTVALAGKGGVSGLIPSAPEEGLEAGPEGRPEAVEGDSDGDVPTERGAPGQPRLPVEPIRPEPTRPRRVVPGQPPVVLEASQEVSEMPPRASAPDAPTSALDARPGAAGGPPKAAGGPPKAAGGRPKAVGGPPRVVDTEAARTPGVRVTPLPGGGPVPSAAPGGAPAGGSRATAETDQSEEEWSEVQIRRSLSAVGRTLGPASVSGLGAPPPTREATPVEREGEGAATLSPDPVGPESPRIDSPQAEPPPAEPGPTGPPQAESAPIAPPATDPRAPSTDSAREEPVGAVSERPEPALLEPSYAWPPTDGMESFVGGSRRRSHIPARTLTLAAAGLIAALGGGWLVLERLGGADGTAAVEVAQPLVAADEAPATTDGDASMAGVTLGQGPLFPRSSDISEVSDAEFLWVGPRRPEVPGGDEASGASSEEAPPAEESLAADADVPAATAVVDPSLEATSRPITEAPPVVPAPGAVAVAVASDSAPKLELGSLDLDDPAVAAFEDALAIFRREVTRYDSLRIAFDDQLAGCNALNLSYRAVRDSYRRLGSRFEAVRDQFAGPGLQAYRSAGRQTAVIDVHYELSECPPPRGG